ncbi:hypothetical protein [Candidatus Enterovibrio escicola]|uniref:hypothetical protein n=1 Tax=Candidatus Enterovibrio escicola TaxID=1927127 RepID=UPI0016804E42|nr:hypothetical protein [Candidatus Enterovibrio escacola]
MLGEYRFIVEITAYQSTSWSTSDGWGKQGRLTTAPTLLFQGSGEDNLSIGSVILP